MRIWARGGLLNQAPDGRHLHAAAEKNLGYFVPRLIRPIRSSIFGERVEIRPAGYGPFQRDARGGGGPFGLGLERVGFDLGLWWAGMQRRRQPGSIDLEPTLSLSRSTVSSRGAASQWGKRKGNRSTPFHPWCTIALISFVVAFAKRSLPVRPRASGLPARSLPFAWFGLAVCRWAATHTHTANTTRLLLSFAGDIEGKI